MISSCNARAIVNKGYVLDGRTIGGKPVEILVPCISKADLAQLLEDFLAAENPQRFTPCARLAMSPSHSQRR
jgi:hypothetical protein